MNVKLIIASTLLFLTACAEIPLQKNSIVTFNIDPIKELGLNQDSLREQVEAAIKSGEKAITFLSTDLFLKANDASMRGDFHTAAQLFKYVDQLKPNDSFVQKKLSIELIRMGDLKEAEKILSKLYQKNHGDESVGLILAGVYTAIEKPVQANSIYKNLIASANSEEACLYLAKFYASEKHFNDAHKLLADCERKNNDEPSFAFYRGKIEHDRGNLNEAKKFYERSLKIDKTFTQAAVGLGSIFEEKEDISKAIVEYKKFLNFEANSSNTTVLNKMVNLMLNSDEYSNEVVSYLEELISLDPTDINLKVRLGILYSESAKYEKAIKTFKDILEVVPESDKILYYLGALYHQSNNYEDSLSYYKKIPSSSPLFGDASIQMGQIYSSLAREDFAAGLKGNIYEFHKFIEERIKDHEEISLELKMVEAGFYDDTFQYKKAIESLSKFQNNKNFNDSHSYFLASIMEKDGQYLEARNLIYKILDKDPNNPHALNFLGYSYLEKKENMEKAFEYINKAVKLKPDDGYIRDSLAWYFYSVGKYSEALKEAKKAFELVNSDVIITKHLAIIYQSLRNYDKAKEYYSVALKNAKAQSERDDVLKLISGLEKLRLPASVSP